MSLLFSPKLRSGRPHRALYVIILASDIAARSRVANKDKPNLPLKVREGPKLKNTKARPEARGILRFWDHWKWKFGISLIFHLTTTDLECLEFPGLPRCIILPPSQGFSSLLQAHNEIRTPSQGNARLDLWSISEVHAENPKLQT